MKSGQNRWYIKKSRCFFHFDIKLFIYVLFSCVYSLLKEKKYFFLIRTPLSDYQQNNQYHQGQYEVRYEHERIDRMLTLTRS